MVVVVVVDVHLDIQMVGIVVGTAVVYTYSDYLSFLYLATEDDYYYLDDYVDCVDLLVHH